MNIAVKLSEHHFRQFLIFNILKRLKLYKSPAIFASILTFSALISFLMHKVEGAVLLGIVLLVVGLGVPVVYFSTFFSSVKRQVAMQKLNPPRLVYTLEFSQESPLLHISNDKEKADYRWQDVHHAYIEKESIYLFLTKDKAFLLPFDVLQDKQATIKLIEAKLGRERCSNHS
ncbi:MAG: YcxB family protein [Sphaerochaeta sp.]|nr:YcxB family protein [uncultured Sphaerochaeta sp.]NCB72714.1 YcxB family protein [Clostridia bacterium]